MKKVPKDYRVRVESYNGAFMLAGRIIRSLLSEIRCDNNNKEKDKDKIKKIKQKRINKIKKQRIEFALGRGVPVIQSWCDISEYSYTKVVDKILQFNK